MKTISLYFKKNLVFQKILSLCIVSIQERFQIKSGLWWRVYGIFYSNLHCVRSLSSWATTLATLYHEFLKKACSKTHTKVKKVLIHSALQMQTCYMSHSGTNFATYWISCLLSQGPMKKWKELSPTKYGFISLDFGMVFLTFMWTVNFGRFR